MGSKYSILATPQWYLEGSKKYGKKGFEQAAKQWNSSDMEINLRGQNFLVTGANSGLGFEAARQFAQRGATVHMLCRNEERGNKAADSIKQETGNSEVHVHIVDVSDSSSVRRFAKQWNSESKPIKVLVNNAGVLPKDLQLSADGLELSFATMMGGAFLLTGLLLPSLQAGAPSRVINVASGGMYTVRLSMDDVNFEKSKYDGTYAYANNKRAMVEMTSLWAEKLKDSNIKFFSMHPGWVDTPGVRESLPQFAEKQDNNLRSLPEGADTIVWLGVCPREEALPSGEFWFDREVARQHMRGARTHSSEADKQQLWEFCEKHMNWSFEKDGYPGISKTAGAHHATSASATSSGVQAQQQEA